MLDASNDVDGRLSQTQPRSAICSVAVVDPLTKRDSLLAATALTCDTALVVPIEVRANANVFPSSSSQPASALHYVRATASVHLNSVGLFFLISKIARGLDC